jgi:hypothetical protein
MRSRFSILLALLAVVILTVACRSNSDVKGTPEHPYNGVLAADFQPGDSILIVGIQDLDGTVLEVKNVRTDRTFWLGRYAVTYSYENEEGHLVTSGWYRHDNFPTALTVVYAGCSWIELKKTITQQDLSSHTWWSTVGYKETCYDD